VRLSSLLCCVLAGSVPLTASVYPAAAQNRGGLAAAGAQAAPEVSAYPQRGLSEAWPRLDPGAILCRTQEDLQRYADNIQAQLAGSQAAGGAACVRITTRTAITILDRAGPGATHVRITKEPDRTGWTDAFLPSKAPPPTVPVSRRP
jgi:hypothetical protein